MKELEGKVALVTGAARGMGRAHVVTLARAGADIAFCDIAVGGDAEADADMTETRQLVEAEGRRCLAVHADVSSSEQMDRLVGRTVAELGRLDIFIANAGINRKLSLAETTDDQWKKMMDINLSGAFFGIRAAGEHMATAGGGRIVAVASGFARQGQALFSAYAASKWGVLGLVKSLALELGPYDITVNAVCPGAIDTPMNSDPGMVGDKNSAGISTKADAEAAVRAITPLPVAHLQPEEVSKAVLFLVGNGGRYVSGIGLDVNAGQSGRYTA